MKTATLQSLRVEPEFREKAESVLKEGETLSGSIEEAVRAQGGTGLMRELLIPLGSSG